MNNGGFLAMLVAAALLPLSGCVTEGGPPPRQKPRVIPEPSGLRADKIVLSATAFPEDVDDNGFADTFRVSVFLFPPENQHPLPIHAKGRFEFLLADQEGREIAYWDLGGDRVERAKVDLLTGPGYMFLLDINEVSSDRVGVTRGSLRCAFHPEVGPPIEVRGPASIRIGPTGFEGVRDARDTPR